MWLQQTMAATTTAKEVVAAPPSYVSSEYDEDDEEEEGWEDVEGADDEEKDRETEEVISLLDDRVFPDVVSMLLHCKEKYDFDFLGIRQRLQLDFHGCVKLVNFIRQRVHEGLPVTEDISSTDIDQDQYLKPVLDDDAVILGLFDLPELVPAAAESLASGGGGAESQALVNDLLKRNNELQEELARVTAQFENYRTTVSKTLDERWGDVEKAETSSEAQASGGGGDNTTDKKEDDSKYYWDSYAGVEIHETMLKDTVRTDAYRDFIYNNKHLFAGKTVLDIGCGTGILSMFCARAGASRVIAVDASDIITKAQANVFHNGLSSTVTCLHGRVEEVTLPVDEVDVIVSEWMGYCLLFEAMLPSVLWARDRYLNRSSGLMVPSHANMWLAPVSDPVWTADNGPAFWRDVYGFDMRDMSAGIYDDARVLRWPADRVAGAPAAFKMLDLYAVHVEDLSFAAPFATSLTRDLDALDGFLIWFDIFFHPQRPQPPQAAPEEASVQAQAQVQIDAKADKWVKEGQDRVAFTTGPFGKETHWKQGLLLIDDQQQEGEEKGGDGDTTTTTTAKKDPTEEEDKKEKEKEGEEEEEKKGGKGNAAAMMKKDDEIKGEIAIYVPEDSPRGLMLKMTWDKVDVVTTTESQEGQAETKKKPRTQIWALK